MITPLERCPRLYQHQTRNDAIALFSLIPSENNPIDLPILLVLDEKNTLVGRLSRTDILCGLVPNMLERSKRHAYFWNRAEYPHLTYLYEDHALAECGGNRNREVRLLMRPIDVALPADTHILEALVVLHNHHAACVPVTESGAVVGLLRFEELFHAVCNTWCILPQG